MVYRKNDGNIGAIDYREKAPLAAHKDMYLDSLGNVIPGMSTIGASGTGVPGTIAGIFEVHKKFGTLPIKDIIDPVIELVDQGVEVTPKQAARLDRYWDEIRSVNGENTLFYNKCEPGDTLRYPALATTLRRIAVNGRDEFYKGETAKILARFIQGKGRFCN